MFMKVPVSSSLSLTNDFSAHRLNPTMRSSRVLDSLTVVIKYHTWNGLTSRNWFSHGSGSKGQDQNTVVVLMRALPGLQAATFLQFPPTVERQKCGVVSFSYKGTYWIRDPPL